MPDSNIRCIFAHFDSENKIKSYILFHLKALKEICSTIDFVTTSPLPESEIAKLKPYADNVIVRPNVGYDFMSWSQVIINEKLHYSDCDQLILTNSSIIGPVHPLRDVLAKMDGFDVWGLTENFAFGRHLQSFFLSFNKKVLLSPTFLDFWSNIIPYRNVDSVISSYETNLTIFFQSAGFKIGAFMDPSFSFKRSFRIFGNFHKHEVNPTFCDVLPQIEYYGMPYVKVKLFTFNPHFEPVERIAQRLDQAGIPADYASRDLKSRINPTFVNGSGNVIAATAGVVIISVYGWWVAVLSLLAVFYLSHGAAILFYKGLKACASVLSSLTPCTSPLSSIHETTDQTAPKSDDLNKPASGN